MENLTMAQVKDFAIVLLALAGVVVLIGNLVKVIKEWKKPHDDMEQWRRDVNTRLGDDDARLGTLEQGNRVISRGILALLSHEINGNSIDKLTASQQEITNFLIDK